MQILSVFVGILFGTVQLIILRCISKSLLSGDTMKMTLFILLKFFGWGIFFAAAAIFFRAYILQLGSGAAAGLILGGFCGFLFLRHKKVPSKKENDI